MNTGAPTLTADGNKRGLVSSLPVNAMARYGVCKVNGRYWPKAVA